MACNTVANFRTNNLFYPAPRPACVRVGSTRAMMSFDPLNQEIGALYVATGPTVELELTVDCFENLCNASRGGMDCVFDATCEGGTPDANRQQVRARAMLSSCRTSTPTRSTHAQHRRRILCL